MPYKYVDGIDGGEALAQRIGTGDRTAETELYRLYCDCVFAMALARTRDREAARELMDEVLMAVISALRRGGVRRTAHLSGFVHGTASNIINGYFRSRRRSPATVPLHADLVGADPADDYESADRRALALQALRLLANRDREILYLSLIEGLKPGEIAARLGVSSAVVRQRKCRALRAIIVYFEDGSRSYAVRRLLRL
jgi:RNA polymerase sigma factor (sigma-70 family)